MIARGLEDVTVVVFESRKAEEMRSLVTRWGGRVLGAPAMREVPLDDPSDAARFVDELEAGAHDAVILMTGVGTRALVRASGRATDDVATALRGVTVVARGPKPAAVLREMGVSGFHLVPEPNTWREIVVTFARVAAAPCRVAVQEHGAPSVELYAALREAGHVVRPVAVYRWALPEDLGPLRAGLDALVSEEAHAALFTSASQVAHVMRVAADDGRADAVRAALARAVVGSIGPVCTEALEAEGIAVDVEPEHPKMGHLVKALAERGAEILSAKRP